jgi:hypothetical protein
MAEAYANTISGLLRKREELMTEAQSLREDLAKVGNDIEALDRTLHDPTVAFRIAIYERTPVVRCTERSSAIWDHTDARGHDHASG